MLTRHFILLCLLALAAPFHAQQRQPEKETEALIVRHIPNPAEGSYSPQLARYKWPYRTEVKNNLEVPLRITHFEVYYYENGKWRPENVKKRALSGADFTEWYDDGDPVVEGWIKPGEVAVDAENWSGSGWYIPSRCKWTFTAKDRDGNEYHVEEEIALIPASPVQLNGKIVYQKFYRHHAGDDTAWAQPEFDDGDWTQIEYGAFPHDWQGIGWFRLHLAVDSTLWNKALALTFWLWGASEIYLDGKLLAQYGKVGSSITDEEGYVVLNPDLSLPKAIVFDQNIDHVLAVRYSNFFLIEKAPNIWHGFQVNLRELNSAIAANAKQREINTKNMVITTSVPIVFAVLHLLLFLFYRRAKENLYYAILMLAIGAASFFASQYKFSFVTDLRQAFLYNNLGQIFLLFSDLAGLRFLYAIFYPRLPKQFWLFLFTYLAVLIWIWDHPFRPEDYANWFATTTLLEMLRIVVVAILKKKDGARIIGTGILFMGVLYGVPIILTGMGILPQTLLFEVTLPGIGITGLLLSMSIYLAWDFARTNKNLEAQLVQVKELSEKTIQQERERAQLEAEHARKTHELEEARQLQLAMLPKTVPKLPHLEIAVYSKPATEVGGDYYDFHLDGNGTLTVAIGDATGHGMKAGTLVSVTKGLFKSLAHEDSLPQILQKMSSALDSMNLGYLYMAMMLVKYQENKITISTAGMPPALRYNAAANQVDEILIKGLPLGGFPNFKYQQAEIEFRPGDALVLMSDGLPEMFNEAGEILDYPTMKKLVEEAAHASPQAIIDYLVAAGEKWANGRPQATPVGRMT
jgi:serine phosphatase RsbU (regulator of sigma subunit)